MASCIVKLKFFKQDELLNSNGLPVREDFLLNFMTRFLNPEVGSTHFLQQIYFSDWKNPCSRLSLDQGA